jgi:hypothetical protein
MTHPTPTTPVRRVSRRQLVAIEAAAGKVSNASIFTLLIALATAVAMPRVLLAQPGDDDTFVDKWEDLISCSNRTTRTTSASSQ